MFAGYAILFQGIFMEQKKHDIETCSLNDAFAAIGGKWKPYIIWYLYDAPNFTCRYGELKRRVPWDISHKMFIQQLQELERDKIINRTEYDDKPRKVEYSLTEEGKILAPIILLLRDWAAGASDKFTKEDLLERTHGVVKDDIIVYEQYSEVLGKHIKIEYKY